MAIKFYPILKPTAKWREIVESHFNKDKETIILARNYPISIVNAIGGPKALYELPFVKTDFENALNQIKGSKTPNILARGFCERNNAHFLVYKIKDLMQTIYSSGHQVWISNDQEPLSGKEIDSLASTLLKNFGSKSC
ncbi:MAG: hypothetical protein JHC93_03620 [Parachlamydiales bacterium]|nr:hypothetical protein [Parachlamydiales bacterium]